MGGGMAGHLHEGNLRLDRKIREHPQDIKLCILLQRHEIQDGNAERPDLLGSRPGLIHHENVFRLQYMLRR